MTFKVNWTLSGFLGKIHEAGAVIEADAEEVAHLVKAGVLTLLGEKPADPAPEADTSTMNDDELVAYALARFGFELDPQLSREAKLIELAVLKAGDEVEDASEDVLTVAKDGEELAVDAMTKADLLAHIAVKFGVKLSERLNKTTILAELASLEAKV